MKNILKEKNGLRAVVFLIVAALLFAYLNSVFTIGDTDASRQIFEDFYNQEEESIDVMYMGTSATNRYFNPPLAYEEEGIAVYNMAIMGMPMFFIPTLIEETDKIMNAQKSRGAMLDSGSFADRIKALVPILIPLFISSLRRAEELATAMECRCYHGGEGRTRLKALKMQKI